MTIKTYDELNEFEKKGVFAMLKEKGYTFAESTHINDKTKVISKPRTIVCSDRISFDLESMSIEVD